MSTQAHPDHHYRGGDALRAHVPGRRAVWESRLPDGQARLPGARGFIFVLAQSFERLLLLVDMVLTFNTSFFDSIRGRWVEERSVIAREYLRCWFWLDVLSLLPYSLMFSEIKAAGLIRVIRLVRLLKLLKLAKQPRIMAKLRPVRDHAHQAADAD